MGEHSRTIGLRVRAALAAGLVALGVIGAVGTAQADDGPDLVEGTPCTDEVSACVDLDARQAWLVDDGKVVRGPVPISPGGPGKETPRGDFHVQWKDDMYYSQEYNNSPMPWSVFFADGGIAFHEGNLNNPSGGCVRLTWEDSEAFYRFLQVDDKVQVR